MLTNTITFKVPSGDLSGYYARPEDKGRRAAIIVIHELLGLNDNILETARRFANQGYACLAVDLFHNRNVAICLARFFSGMLLNSLNHGAIRDLKASLTYLAGLPGVNADRLGAIGFCMGGSFAIAWACTDERLKVIAPYYSTNPRPIDAVARACPVVGSFPEKDYISRGAEKLREALDRHNVPNDIKLYPGSKHSFFNKDRGVYNAAAAEDSWQRTIEFFRTYLS